MVVVGFTRERLSRHLFELIVGCSGCGGGCRHGVGHTVAIINPGVCAWHRYRRDEAAFATNRRPGAHSVRHQNTAFSRRPLLWRNANCLAALFPAATTQKLFPPAILYIPGNFCRKCAGIFPIDPTLPINPQTNPILPVLLTDRKLVGISLVNSIAR